MILSNVPLNVKAMEINEIIARNIAGLRKKKGWTQQELATQLNYSDKAISKWERGISLPDAGTLYDIATLFGVSIQYLYEEHEFIVDSDQEKKLNHRKNLYLAISIGSAIFLTVTIILLGVTYVAKAIGNDMPLAFVYIDFILAGIMGVLAVIDCIFYPKNHIRPVVYISVAIWDVVTGLYFVFHGEYFFWILLGGILLQTFSVVYLLLMRHGKLH